MLEVAFCQRLKSPSIPLWERGKTKAPADTGYCSSAQPRGLPQSPFEKANQRGQTRLIGIDCARLSLGAWNAHEVHSFQPGQTRPCRAAREVGRIPVSGALCAGEYTRWIGAVAMSMKQETLAKRCEWWGYHPTLHSLPHETCLDKCSFEKCCYPQLISPAPHILEIKRC